MDHGDDYRAMPRMKLRRDVVPRYVARTVVAGSRRAISKPMATCFEVTIIDFKCIRCPPNNRLQQISDPLLALVDRRQRMKQNCLFASKIGKN